jgi:hypothetical protein
MVSGFQRVVLPGYFEAMRIAPRAGRLLEDADRAAGEAVLVNTTVSSQYFGGSPLGHTLRTLDKSPRTWRIVGVVPDVRHGGPEAEPGPEMYVLPDPAPPAKSALTLAMVIRLRPGAALSDERLKAIAASVGPRVLVGAVTPATALVREQVAAPRHRMLLLTLLGVFGLLLTLVGIFSTTAYAVARRTREVGVRIALGARPTQVVGTMVRDAVWPVAAGLAAGLAGTHYATRLIASFLFRTQPHEPATLATAVALLAVAAGLAAWLPARRAASVDPLIALRAE